MGRPSSMTAERARAAIKHRRRGMPVEHVATAIGVSERSLRRWLTKGGEPKADRRFREFRRDFMAAWALRASDCLGAIVADFDDDEDESEWDEEERGPKRPPSPLRSIDWKRLAWWVQRTAPQSFGEPRSDGTSRPRAEADLEGLDQDPTTARDGVLVLLQELPRELLEQALAAREG